MSLCKYRDINLRPASLAIVQICNNIIDEYLEQDLKLTLRQLYYQLVSRDELPNQQKEYKRLGGIVSDARLAGLMDWDAIEDRARRPDTPPQWGNVEELVDSALAAYRLPRWEGQNNYVELWVEKDALSGVLAPIARSYHVTLMVNRGYSSQSAMYESAQRILDACSDGQYPHILYLGDHDPSGEDMVRDVQDRLAMFGVEELQVRKVALTTEQVDQYQPPENPVKLTDSRADSYVRRHGRHCWEVDALTPTTLRDIIDRDLRALIDTTKMDAIKRREDADKKKLRKAARAIGSGRKKR